MHEPSKEPLTALLARWRAGDADALTALVPLVYQELRRVAHRYLQKERCDHTLQSTALVHEAYLRLINQQRTSFENRAHFLAICAQLMRQVLVEYARSRAAAKRNGGQKLTLDDSIGFVERRVELVVLDEALHELARLDPQQSRIVELRFFAGLSIEQTALVMDLSPATVKRYWATARIWLHHEMSNRHDT